VGQEDAGKITNRCYFAFSVSFDNARAVESPTRMNVDTIGFHDPGWAGHGSAALIHHCPKFVTTRA